MVKVRINGKVETRPERPLVNGDKVTYNGQPVVEM
jgi:ribosome-associated protein YbcJ (S4-like RNA binding protein)